MTRFYDSKALVEAHYDTLKSLAREKRRRSARSHTMLTTDILHESWLKLRHEKQWTSESHFLKTTAQAMRHVLIDHARAKLTQKRQSNGMTPYDDVEEYLPEFKESPEQIVAIGGLFEQLGEHNERYQTILDMRYFGGFTEEETAKALALSPRTVRRDWVFIKAWIAKQLNQGDNKG